MALAGPAPAHAQVNVEALRSQLKEASFGARVAGSLSSYAGNTQGVILGSAGLVGARLQRHTGFLAVSGDYARLNHVVSVAKWFGHARHNYRLMEALWWEGFGQLESDRFRRVASRRLLGTGLRVQLFDSEALEVFYGVAYLHEHSDLASRQAGSAGEGTAHRFGNYAAVTLRAHRRIVLTSVSYVQPRFDAPSDAKILNVTQAAFEIAGMLRSRIDATLRYDSVGPADVNRADLELKNSLELVF
ncbi:MAG TPA: DUF481 domain-containing protein [Polyangiaceae bacterium]|nr:DUF481 domain-containing protein [Polyangiaceae bacterium]